MLTRRKNGSTQEIVSPGTVANGRKALKKKIASSSNLSQIRVQYKKKRDTRRLSKLFNINYRIHSLILHEPALTKERSHNDLHLILAWGCSSPSVSETDVGDGGGGGDGMVLIMVLQG